VGHEWKPDCSKSDKDLQNEEDFDMLLTEVAVRREAVLAIPRRVQSGGKNV